MKKLIILMSLLFLSIIFNVKLYAAPTWEFRWTNTTVEVPLGESIEKYKYIPVAKLYKDDMLLSDANISYMRDGDWLYFLKDVNTSVCGNYKVWYKAQENNKYRPGTCNGYKCLVEFIVKDKIFPTMTILKKDLFIERSNSLDEYKINQYKELLINNVIAKDNYSNCTIVIDENIDYKKVGTYKVNVFVHDEDKNCTSNSFNVTIYDENIPVINFINNTEYLNVPMNADIDIKEYFNAKDILDGDISSDIEYPYFDNSYIHDFNYTVSVTNKGGNTATKTICVHVVDGIAPEIKLKTNSIVMDYLADFENMDYRRYIDSIIDNNDIDYDNLTIEYTMENKVGKYSIIYSYFDGYYTAVNQIDVTLVSRQNPILVVGDIKLEKNTNKSLYEYVTVYDESDPNINSNLVIDDNDVNYNEAGSYEAYVYVANSSGLSSKKKINVIIEDNNKTDMTIVIMIIIISILSVATILYIIFFVYYFVIKKKRNKDKINNLPFE